ncbi:hypothetical protein CHS0354_027130 [Potamilus streckersoni]|uniref:TIR domain-containing protein n=1 Tax=Potamilus streckersoni TaxID=2493646 RepID=A0AAE0VK43_9BIVA|nr:hypothetical protein CHS0354_027130 [Potamilus streckersoni]
MAMTGSKEVGCNLVEDITLKLEGDHKTQEVLMRDEGRKPIISERTKQIEQGVQKMDITEEIYLRASDRTIHDECKVSSQKRDLPPGKKYHVFFSYSSSDMQWVKETLERLEKDHGFVCCEYDQDNIPGTPLVEFASDSIRNAYKTIVVMTREAFNSGFVKYEINMAINHGINEDRICVVPVLLEDCDVPLHLSVLNYVDASDSKKREIWWPKLISELDK